MRFKFLSIPKKELWVSYLIASNKADWLCSIIDRAKALIGGLSVGNTENKKT
jgi:hypothetical protein